MCFDVLDVSNGAQEAKEVKNVGHRSDSPFHWDAMIIVSLCPIVG